MTAKERAAPDAVVDAFTPDAKSRMAVPATPPPVDPDPGERLKHGQARAAGQIGQNASAQPAHRTAGARRSRKLTPLKRLERYVSAIFKLGRTEGMAKNAKKRVTAAELRMDAIEGELAKFAQDIRQLRGASDAINHNLDAAMTEVYGLSERVDRVDDLADEMTRRAQAEAEIVLRATQAETALLARIFGDLSRRVDQLSLATGQPAQDIATPDTGLTLPAADGFSAFKDSFYHKLENRYRGSVEEITRRLQIYLPDVEAAHLRTGRKPAMDIGCGRGEWLGLMKTAGIEAFGVDTNAVQIDAAKEEGLDVRLGDAMAALAEMEDASLSVLSAHHLVEHLPFDAVAWITREAMRVLAPGGILLFETPHTRNVLVGATTFHTDPTHLKPMPEQVLTVLFETAGFDPVEARGLNPHERFDEFLAKPDFNNELAFLMFGPQDLAVLGTRPTGD